jgi:nitroimidazol reductase NimA-like FMN-containing flavoprotein (pyridoxamine 5'-phosphate oxidase superfamily)
MAKDLKDKISDYLATHPYLNLATVCPDGTPLAHTVGYASEGATVYFVTDRKSRKARNIASNPAVAFTVDEDYENLADIQGIQMKGMAEEVTDPAVMQRVMRMMNEKYPYMKDLPENPDYGFFVITPGEAIFIDNTQGFGHRETMSF